MAGIKAARMRILLPLILILCELVYPPVGAAALCHLPLVKIGAKNFKYNGLTDEGVAVLRKARDTLRGRVKLFGSEFRSLDSVHHAGMVARLAKLNMLLYGPPGAAKSGVVNWLMKGELEVPFKLQMHQMITEQAFVGGQNYEMAKQGRFEVNTEVV